MLQSICSWQRKTQNTHRHKQIYAQLNGPSVTKPNPENCKNCSSKCAYDCAQLQYTIQHKMETEVARLQPVIRVTPPNTASHSCTNHNESLPDPQRQKHNPVVPLYDAIKTQGKQQAKHQQAAIHYEFATTTRRQRSVKNVSSSQQ